nr:putative cleavage and polyadenylation specificity factor subunit 4-like protein isoform X2 [Macaca nemestrina]
MSYIGPTCLGSGSFRSPSRRWKMQEVIAGLERFTFAFEEDVEMQKGTGLLPFPGMDKSASAVCNFFAKGLCEKGKLCPFRHDRGEKMVVCKHWLRGLCKKGDHCKFLHQYDITRMPECYFYSKFGPLCKYRHVPRIMCLNYLVGFCPEGPKCRFSHPKMNLLFNPSYTKVSAGRHVPSCLVPLFSLLSAPQGSSPSSTAWLQANPHSPLKGSHHACRAHMCGCSSQTPLQLLGSLLWVG